MPDRNYENLKSRLPAIYARLIDQTSEFGFYIMDPDGVIVSWNPGVEKLFGYRESEWVGQSGQFTLTTEDRANGVFQSEINSAIQTGQATDLRWRQRKDGGRIFVDSLLISFWDETGSVLCLADFVRDATNQEVSRRKIRGIEERLRLVQDGASLGIWDWDVIADSIDASESYYRMMGMAPQLEPLSYTKWILLINPWDRDRMAISIREALRTGDFHYEFDAVWPDGSHHWFHVRGTVQYANGQPARMVRVLRDITAERASQHALRDSEALNNAIVRASLDAVILMDDQGILKEFNPAAEDMFGHSREDVMGKRLAEVIIPPRLRQQHRDGLNRYLLTEKATVIGRHIETEGLRADGTEFPVELAITRVPVGDKPLFAGYVRDISERRQALLALQRSNEELADFAHTVAHDLRTPLRNVSTYIQLLSREYQAILEHKGNEFLSLMRQSAEAMQALIEGLLRYAEGGAREAIRENTNVTEVAKTTITLMKPGIEAAGADVVLGDLPTVESDPLQLQQVFQNLIGNAIKYKGQEPPRIVIDSRRSSDNWVISVTDNGQGIRAEDQDRIFMPLKRLHGHEIAGSGLGLSICRAVMKRLGGRIWVESEVGVGSTFYFTLPYSSLRQRAATKRKRLV